VTVQPGSWQEISTRGQDVVASGYARLDCSQPVFASLTYSLQSANGTPLGIATIPGAPIASNALIPMVLNGRYRAARSHYVAFADEIFSVPSQGSGTFEVLANGSVGSGNFNIMGLLFDGGAFTNVVPAIVGP
jgi:hypothetical protein